MALSKLIDINPGPGGAHFVPATLNVVAGDEITWSNNDPVKAHWPILTAIETSTGTIPGENKTYFMPNQIAPGDPSDDFRPGDTVTTTLHYRCWNHSHEVGRIVVAPAGGASNAAG